MVNVEALTGFDHGGNRRRGSRFSVSENTAKALARAGLVRIIEDRPKKADGAKSSALPAAQASPQTTARPRNSGGKDRKTGV